MLCGLVLPEFYAKSGGGDIEATMMALLKSCAFLSLRSYQSHPSRNEYSIFMLNMAMSYQNDENESHCEKQVRL